MQIQRVVFLRIFSQQGFVGEEGHFLLFVIISIIRTEYHCFGRIYQLHIAACVTETAALVVTHRVANHVVRTAQHIRTIVELAFAAERIVPTTKSKYRRTVTNDLGRRNNGSFARVGVVIERVGVHHKIGMRQHDIVFEEGHFRIGTIASVARFQHIGWVDDFSAKEEISDIGHAVVIQMVGEKLNILVGHHHIGANLCNFAVAVVIKRFAVEGQGVALFDVHVSVGIQGVAGFEEMRRVAKHPHTVVTKLHIANQHLEFCIDSFVKFQSVGMLNVNHVLRLHTENRQQRE